MSPPVSRRSLLAGGVGLAAVAGVALTGCEPFGRHVAGHSISGRLHSKWMKGPVGWTIHYPPGHTSERRLPVVVSLHGKGGSHATSFTQLHLDSVVNDLVARGMPAFAVASVDGGADGYWHRRTDGTDAGAMVVDDFVPMLAHQGLRTSRLGLFGWSMGGYGSLLLAGKHRASPRAVAVLSPALFASAGLTAAGAFDSPQDFESNDVAAHPEWFRGLPLRVDIGRSDPFYAVTRRFVGELHPHPAGGFEAGGHDASYWRRMAPAQFRFLGKHLTA
jgi:pimeloyl-ACP methyl ester carboxylesterase